jgi:surface protein
MFNECKSLEKLDISGWDTSNVTNMSFMFSDCESLKKLNISNWDTSKVYDMSYMFDNCNDSIIPYWYKNNKRLTENKLNFNPIDYSDDGQDMIDNQTVLNMVYKYHPKTKEEL